MLDSYPTWRWKADYHDPRTDIRPDCEFEVLITSLSGSLNTRAYTHITEEVAGIPLLGNDLTDDEIGEIAEALRGYEWTSEDDASEPTPMEPEACQYRPICRQEYEELIRWFEFYANIGVGAKEYC